MIHIDLNQVLTGGDVIVDVSDAKIWYIHIPQVNTGGIRIYICG
jgi:hypothetical protein